MANIIKLLCYLDSLAPASYTDKYANCPYQMHTTTIDPYSITLIMTILAIAICVAVSAWGCKSLKQ